MKLSYLLAGALASGGAARLDPRTVHAGSPQLVGGRQFLSELKARTALAALLTPPEARVEERKASPDAHLEGRENSNGQCGQGFGSCTSNCCSPAG